MSDELWHETRTKSRWNGDTITWCGLRFPGGSYESDLFYLGGKTCPACAAAKRGQA